METTQQASGRRQWWLWPLLLAGVALPFVLAALVPYYHRGDLMGYSRWADCLEAFGPAIYLECLAYRPLSPLDYPPLGLLLSAGAIHVIRLLAQTADQAVTDGIFRGYLAIYAALDFLLIVWLARMMRFRRPVIVGLVLMLMPWMVVGGILWGQLDGLSLMLCLLTFIAILQAQRSAVRHSAGRAAVWLTLAAFGLAGFMLVKQINTFSLLFFALLLAATLFIFWRQLRGRGLLAAGAALVVWAVSFRLIDTRFDLPPQYLDSAFWYSWVVGAGFRGAVIAANGFNMWILLGRDMWSSPKEPFATLHLGPLSQDITPYHTGIVLYLVFVAFLFATALIAAWHVLRRDAYARLSGEQHGAIIAALCLLLGLSQLGFNVLLTGTHERYLFLGYPFLLLSVLWFASRKVVSIQLAVFVFVAAALNGIFVFGAMQPLPGALFIVYSNAFQATLHLILWIALLDVWLRVVRRISRQAPAQADPA